LGIRSRVIFVGISSQVPELLRSVVDVFVMPSIYEGLPIALLEAQAAGLPCVVSDTVSREAMVSQGSVKFLSLERGPNAWAAEINEVLKSGQPELDVRGLMRGGDFNIVVSAQMIQQLYDTAAKPIGQ